MMTDVTVAVLGGFRVSTADGVRIDVPPKCQALLAYLSVHAGRPQLRSNLATLLWSDAPEHAARHSLRQAVLALRKALRPATSSLLVVTPDTIAVDAGQVEVDSVIFERLLAQGTPEALERAAERYQGDLLAGIGEHGAPFEEWLLGERERLRELALEALAKLFGHWLKAGDADRALLTGVRLLTLDPLQEAVHRALMRVYMAQGRRGAALRQYQLCVAALRREIGTEPEAATKALYQELLSQPAPRPSAPWLAFEHLAPMGRFAAAGVPDEPSAVVGRETELVALHRLLGQASTGAGQAVAILGEAGIGKSHLVTTLRADAAKLGALVMVGRCYEMEQIFPLGPWVDALRTLQLTRHVELLEGLQPIWRRELAAFLPELGEPDGESGGTPRDQIRLFEAVTHLIFALAARHPIVIVLEDLHWADETTVRLWFFLSRRIHHVRVLLVATVREGEVGEADLVRLFNDLTREGRATLMRLGPLSRPDTHRLVQRLASGALKQYYSVSLEEQVWGISEGNPFVAVETMAGLPELGPEDVAPVIVLPQRVQQAISDRLARLSPVAQHVMTVAAVIGRAFDFPLLLGASGRSEGETVEGLEELVRRRVLHWASEQCDFIHERLREVVLRELPPPRRRALHRQVAEAIEALHGDDVAVYSAVLGIHFLEGEVWSKALTYLYQAGKMAISRSAFRTAGAAFREALVSLEHLPPSRERDDLGIDLRLARASSLLVLGDVGESEPCLREAEAIAARVGDPVRRARVAADLSNYFSLTGDQDRAIALGRRAQDLADQVSEPALQTMTSSYLGQAWYTSGAYRQAAAAFTRGLSISTASGDLTNPGILALPSVRSSALLAWCLAEMGEFDEAFRRGHAALEMARATERRLDLVHAYRAIGRIHLVKGEPASAARMLDEALRLVPYDDATIIFQTTAAMAGCSYAFAGRIDEALALVAEAMKRPAPLRALTERLRWIAETYVVAGRLDQASTIASEALDLACERGERGHQAHARRLLGDILTGGAGPEIERAETQYRAAAALAEELEMRPLAAQCHLGLGRLCVRLQRSQEARSHLRAAGQMFRELDMPHWVEQSDQTLKGSFRRS